MYTLSFLSPIDKELVTFPMNCHAQDFEWERLQHEDKELQTISITIQRCFFHVDFASSSHPRFCFFVFSGESFDPFFGMAISITLSRSISHFTLDYFLR